MALKSKDAKKLLTYNITTYTKGFVSVSTIDGVIHSEFFQFREIHKILHHPGKGVEIVGYNRERRVFYNDVSGESTTLYNTLNNAMTVWMGSNLN